MKPKHASLAAIVLITILIGATGWYEVANRIQMSSQAGLGAIKPLSEMKVPDKPVLARMDRLERQMHLLSMPPLGTNRRADLSGLGYFPVSVAQSAPNGDPATPAAPAYRVTLAFDGRAKRYCMVDGRLYAEGAVLPDGAAIEKIESRRVLIAKKNIQQWLAVEPFFDSGLRDKSQQGENG